MRNGGEFGVLGFFFLFFFEIRTVALRESRVLWPTAYVLFSCYKVVYTYIHTYGIRLVSACGICTHS